MKVIVYQEQKKFTVNNVSIPNIRELSKIAKMIQEEKLSDLTLSDLRLHKFAITSTRGMMDESEEVNDEALEKEIEEGIRWNSETLN